MANKTRKRNTKKIDKELNQLLKEKNKIDDLTEVKNKSLEKKKTTRKKKEAIVTPERKKKNTTKKKEAVVTPERRSVKNKKKSQARRVIVNQAEKEAIKQNNKQKDNKTSNKSSEDKSRKKIKARAVIVKPEEKEKIKQNRQPARIISVEDVEQDSLENVPSNEIVEDVVVSEEEIVNVDFTEDDKTEEETIEDFNDVHEEVYEEGRYQELMDAETEVLPIQDIVEEQTEVTYPTYPSEIDSTMELFHDDELSDTFKRLQVLEDEMRDLYNKSSEEVPMKEQEEAEASGVLVLDSAIVDQDEKVVRKRSALTIITVILFIIFMLLFIAFIAFVIYVCTY